MKCNEHRVDVLNTVDQGGMVREVVIVHLPTGQCHAGDNRDLGYVEVCCHWVP